MLKSPLKKRAHRVSNDDGANNSNNGRKKKKREMREKSCFLGQSTHTRDKNMTIAYPNCKNDETTKQFKQNGSDNNNK